MHRLHHSVKIDAVPCDRQKPSIYSQSTSFGQFFRTGYGGSDMPLLSGSEPSTTTTIDMLGRSALQPTPSTSSRSFFDFGGDKLMYKFRTHYAAHQCNGCVGRFQVGGRDPYISRTLSATPIPYSSLAAPVAGVTTLCR